MTTDTEKRELLLGWDKLNVILDFEEHKDDPENQGWTLEEVVEYQWDSLCENLTQLMEGIDPRCAYWAVGGANLGWRRVSKRTRIEARTGAELLESALPNTECTFNIYAYEQGERRGFAIHNGHHDTTLDGEWYYILPWPRCADCGDQRECSPEPDADGQHRCYCNLVYERAHEHEGERA